MADSLLNNFEVGISSGSLNFGFDGRISASTTGWNRGVSFNTIPDLNRLAAKYANPNPSSDPITITIGASIHLVADMEHFQQHSLRLRTGDLSWAVPTGENAVTFDVHWWYG